MILNLQVSYIATKLAYRVEGLWGFTALNNKKKQKQKIVMADFKLLKCTSSLMQSGSLLKKSNSASEKAFCKHLYIII